MELRPMLVLALVALVAAQRKYYIGHKVYEVQPTNEEQVEVLDSLRNTMEFWKFSRDMSQKCVVMVTPSQEILFKYILEEHGIKNNILIEDLERVFEVERQKQAVALRRANGGISFDAYHRHGRINNYLDGLAKKYPQLVKVEDVGRSYEGRTIKMIKISSGGNDTKSVIFIDACIHASEWSTPAFALYVINQLVENYSKNYVMLKNVDWYLIPVLNPDGYEYAHTTERLWRKTRSPTRDANCIGVDANRNFDIHWSMTHGASDDPCSRNYKGEHSESEPEVRMLSNLLHKYKTKIKLYIALHTYGNYILTPYGFVKDLPEDYEDIAGLGRKVSDAVTAVTGSNYTVGSSSNILYYSSGSGNDYVYESVGVKYSYTWELPAGGKHGFDYPPELIDSMVKETFIGMQAFSKHVAEHF